ncbi:DEAD/DEAH box helicase [Candidatus Venteria ishoeyi]|uniref:ATP-dependent RNA helicase RhlB n=1 Tax=Candidatus Venteria ishoeyi TaxID=1899563 RepID=A0A1H6F5I8_9GAMM|nr:DEAD/DEAH box helicase [Candidatus Venteria ishoeyi]SEH04549.1 ATP-dependent RNA helicase RhlB [Candidatus Venteria ishoeyi]
MIKKLFNRIREVFKSAIPAQSKAPVTQQQADRASASASPEKRGKNQRQPRQSKNQKPRWSVEQFQVAPEEGKTRFHDFHLSTGLMHAIANLKFEYCSPIQAETLPITLKGKDLIGKAQTGTGKTAAFLITILNHMQRNRLSGKREPGKPRALILAPTRELAIQIGKDARELSRYLRSRTVTVFGGADYRKQQTLLEQPVDILVATPGRLLDFKQRKNIDLSGVEVLVLDEADRMLDMGFIPDVRQIVLSTPFKDKRQTLFFSATFTDDVKRLADQWTRGAISVEIEPETVAAETVEQVIYIVTSDQKYTLLYNLITQQKLQRVMVFTNRRDETRDLADKLRRNNIRCAMLSGEVAQNKRTQTLEDFREGKIQVLVATDVAGRGIHIAGVSHVVNYHLPQDPEDYVHRIGRTGRAGEEGTAVSFACEEEAFQIPDIQAFLGRDLPCVQPEESLLAATPPLRPKHTGKKSHHSRHRPNSSGKTGNKPVARPEESTSPAHEARKTEAKPPQDGEQKRRPKRRGPGRRLNRDNHNKSSHQPKDES